MSQTVAERVTLQPASRPTGEELFRMGMGHATGLSAPRDLVRAHALFDIAARLGSLEAKIYRHELGDEMDPCDVAEAQRLARDWLVRLTPA
jgi:TPR repeat protein